MKTLQVTDSELAILKKGIALWEHEPATNSLLGNILKIVFEPGKTREELEIERKKEFESVQREIAARKLVMTRLTTLLTEIESRPEEFTSVEKGEQFL
jgi:F0F1-type ATP synthase alpha subunit